MSINSWEQAIDYLLNVDSFYYHPKCVLSESGGLIYIKVNDNKVIKRSPDNAIRYLNAHIQF